METEFYQWIAGQRRSDPHGSPGQVTNPASGALVASGQLATGDHVVEAVAAAKAVQPDWARATPAERSAVLHRWAALLGERAEELAQLETSQTGKPLRLCREFDVPGTIDNTEFFAGAARHLEGKASAEYSADHTSTIRREAIGVVGSISPWNYPLQMAAWKALPALAAGNAVVLKPSELTPLTTLLFAELAQQAGLPDGLFNVLVGSGQDVGQALVAHPDIAMVSFTGSTAAGRKVMAAAAQTTKRVHLELGGKAPFVVHDDADLVAAAHGAVAGALINSGQDCTAATRAIVHRSLYSEFVELVAGLVRQIRVGDPLDPDTDLGPLVGFAHRDRVAAQVARARLDGADIVCGGSAPDGPLAGGAYYMPTLIAGVTPQTAIWRDEVFGPVLAVTVFDADVEAIELANDTPYGLAASVWTTNVVRAARATREIQAGCVWVNDHIPIISEMPHGGVKASGFGKDMSSYSLEEYTAIKHIMTDITGQARKPWHRTIFTLRKES
ncbi:MAG: gamma-aminobutyraldehyde dehydrogenase [Angustibacter sp.]